MAKGALPMDQKAFHMTLLYDFYGDLLTDRQREFYDLYHNEDLSLAEIAENAGITRQGVRDVLVRAEATLNEIEEKTGLIQRSLKVRAGLKQIQAAAERIADLNNGVLNSTELADLVETIQTTVTMLKE